MTVYIVLRNGEVDAVFSSEAAARHHAKALNKKWNGTEIITKEVFEI
jgi:ABC-type amino acid transport substrate-binding protein